MLAILGLPVLALMIHFAIWSLWLTVLQQGSERSCLRGVLQAQEQLIATNEQILALNGQALRLIAEKKIILETMKRAGPKAALVLGLRLKKILQQQTQLRLQQQKLFAQGQAQMQSSLHRSRLELLAHQKKLFSSLGLSSSGHVRVQIWPRPSALRPLIQEVAPPYVRGPGYSNRQMLALQWQTDVQPVSRRLLGLSLQAHKSVSEKCQSQPGKSKGGNPWHVDFRTVRAW